MPAEAPAAAVARFVAALRAEPGLAGSAGPGVVVVYAPDEIRNLTAAPRAVPALVQAVKDEFDPGHRMAPGRLADPA